MKLSFTKIFFKATVGLLLLTAQTSPTEGAIQDPIKDFYSTVFSAVAKVIYPNQRFSALSAGLRRIFVEKLADSRAAKTPFFKGFILSFFCHGAIPLFKRSSTTEQLEATTQALTDFLSGHGFNQPQIPKLLSSQNTVRLDTKQTFSEQTFDEFFTIHHYCLAWEDFAFSDSQEAEKRAHQTMHQTYAQQLEQELKLVHLELEREKSLYEKDKIQTLRAREQKNQKLEELEKEEKTLELQRAKDKLEHEKALQKLEAARKNSELSSAATKERAQQTHTEKMSELERKKVELELKSKQAGFFEKTVNKFSDCLDLIQKIKIQTPLAYPGFRSFDDNDE